MISRSACIASINSHCIGAVSIDYRCGVLGDRGYLKDAPEIEPHSAWALFILETPVHFSGLENY